MSVLTRCHNPLETLLIIFTLSWASVRNYKITWVWYLLHVVAVLLYGSIAILDQMYGLQREKLYFPEINSSNTVSASPVCSYANVIYHYSGSVTELVTQFGLMSNQ